MILMARMASEFAAIEASLENSVDEVGLSSTPTKSSKRPASAISRHSPRK